MADAEARPKKSDLGVRTASALVMVGVAGTALWLGGTAWMLFVMAVAVGVLWEWRALALKFASGPKAAAWIVAGMIYVGLGAAMLLFLRGPDSSVLPVLTIVGAVVATDIGAYFAGRMIGGPKIAPMISPSKTWAGLGGGIAGASLVMGVYLWTERSSLACDIRAWHCVSDGGMVASALGAGAIVATVAQAGDFFESWMKRRAGVKDSGSLIPGHGGLFDRVDGLLAVMAAGALAWLVSALS